MRRRAGLLAALLLALAGPAALADAPAASLRPVAREDVFPVALPSFAPARSLRPMRRPQRVEQAAARRSNAARAPARSDRAGPIGAICGDRSLRGQNVGPVPAQRDGCGIRQGAVRLHAVGDVRLSRPALMECDTARALKTWIETGMAPSVGGYGNGVGEVKVAAGYACRTRNSRPGARVSEHGKGRAIDISAFRLKSGATISVRDDWGQGTKGRILKNMHKSACGTFGTVLGPESDRYHKDHFHFDIARHRGGAYCR